MPSRDPLNQYGSARPAPALNTSPLLPRQTMTQPATKLADQVFPAGVIMQFAGGTAPDGWLICNGMTLNRDFYSGLFAVIGTTYGAPDGSSFNIPDMRGRTPAGLDLTQTEFNSLAKTGGAKTNTHNHWTGSSFDGGGIYMTNTGNMPRTRVLSLGHAVIGTGNINDNTRQDSTYDETISVLQPYITINFIIRY